jgi:uroporphyrin-III C-methyltransferase
MTTVYLVGAGPGPLDLLTLRAATTIARADVLMFDALVNDEVVALASHAEKISVGKRAGQHSARQVDINALLVEHGLAAKAQGKTVVRLKGGDPLVFARAEEEIDALNAAGIEFEIVSGITSAQAAHASIKAQLRPCHPASTTRRFDRYPMGTPNRCGGKRRNLHGGKRGK